MPLTYLSLVISIIQELMYVPLFPQSEPIQLVYQVCLFLFLFDEWVMAQQLLLSKLQ